MSRITTFFDALNPGRQVGKCLQRDMHWLGIRIARPKVRFRGTSTYPFDCEISRRDSRYTLTFAGASTGPHLKRVACERASTFAYWLWHCPRGVDVITVNMSDGEQPSGARFAASVREPHFAPLPDAFFFSYRGYRQYRRQAEDNPVPWHDRSGVLRWRGTTSGRGAVDGLSPEARWDLNVLPRIRMALILRQQPGCDVAFSFSGWGAEHAESLRVLGLLRDPVPESGWIGDKFALDIDGNTNTWSNFLVRLHLGCCVLKIDSQDGYRQWYYDRIRPWEHFVPVKADMSDLIEKIDWARSNDARAREIAANGQAFARTMTFESETAWAAAAISAANGVS